LFISRKGTRAAPPRGKRLLFLQKEEEVVARSLFIFILNQI
jgi:hypothetical protein